MRETVYGSTLLGDTTKDRAFFMNNQKGVYLKRE